MQFSRHQWRRGATIRQRVDAARAEPDGGRPSALPDDEQAAVTTALGTQVPAPLQAAPLPDSAGVAPLAAGSQKLLTI